MTARTNRPDPLRSELLLAAGLVVVGVLVVMALVAYRLGGGTNPSWNPGLLAELAAGRRRWPTTASAVLFAEFAALALAATATARLLGKRAARHGPRRDIDVAAKTMANVKKVQLLDEEWSRGEAQRLAPAIPAEHPFRRGLLMGFTVRGGLPVHLPWEWVVVAIAGTRMGKTAALAVPAVCAAPGPCVATSNKLDIWTDTRGPRQRMGQLWLFDLQGVTTGEPGPPRFYWNPLKPVFDLPSAKKAASYWVGASKEDGARVDAYFDGSAQDILATYMLAAALAGGDMVHAVEWMANDQSTIPATILKLYDEHAAARMLASKQAVTERQRDGYFDMARRFLEALDAQRYAQAILPPRRITIGVHADGFLDIGDGEPIHDLPEFDPTTFATSTDTLYALSKEGPDSAAALTTALVGIVLDAAEAAAARTPSGRLPIPMVAVLDEAANVVRLQELPKQYSHFGSRGILPITILQSPSQGKDVWGATKFQIMLDAANCIWYGGNTTDRDFLTQLSELIGEHYVRHDSTSAPTGWLASGSASRSSAWQPEAILKPSPLAALPGDRAILQLPGSTPLLLRKAFWTEGPYADQIRKSSDTTTPVPEPREHT